MPRLSQFTRLTLDGDTLVVRGVSPAPADTIVDIQIGIELGNGADSRVEFGPVEMVGETWIATLPATAASGPDFAVGQQVLTYGVETRRAPLRTVTWAETHCIEAAA
jgi:hypothetical protein